LLLALNCGESGNCSLGCIIAQVTSKRFKLKPLAAANLQGSPQRRQRSLSQV